FLDAWWLLGIDGEGRGSGVEVVEWSRKWGRGGNDAGRKNGQGATVVAILNVGKIITFGDFTQLVPGVNGD
nr:hypothetical protein [Tanacetum cinerariifolium]